MRTGTKQTTKELVKRLSNKKGAEKLSTRLPLARCDKTRGPP